jgi:Zn finger protein HypA/HybF involved in hydrogenase expression
MGFFGINSMVEAVFLDTKTTMYCVECGNILLVDKFDFFATCEKCKKTNFNLDMILQTVRGI